MDTRSKMTDDPKRRDMKHDIIDCTSASALTTDYSVKICDTDNWVQVEGLGWAKLRTFVARGPNFEGEDTPVLPRANPRTRCTARGTGAFGHLKVYDDRASKYIHSPVLTDPLRTTPIFIRFSTVQGSRGSADTVRDVRGFAMKFYTPEGNWDLVANNIPVFFIQDAVKFPDLIHAVKPEPHNEVPQGQTAHNNFWDFVGFQSESAHMIMWIMSDRAIPRSFRMMQGFRVNTYTLINAKGERFFALKISGQDPDFHRKDLNEAIENGCPPKWTFAIQVLEEKDEHKFDSDVLDATKIWLEELVPKQTIGEFVLDRTVDEFFPEIEQAAFCTSHIVPGIGFSDDPLLQGRNFSYFDTQISRLGINWGQLPINRPICPVLNHNRDGKMNHRIHANRLNYYPNRKDAGHPVPPSEGGYAEFKEKVAGIKQRVRSVKFQEHYNQAQLFYNSLAPHEKAHALAAFSFELSHCDDPEVYKTYTKILNNVDFDLAKSVAQNVDGTIPEEPARPNHGQISVGLSQQDYQPTSPTIATRRIAILVADGFDMSEVQAVRAALVSAKATTWIIGPRRGKVYSSGRHIVPAQSLVADHHFEGQRSTLFDAAFVPSGVGHAKALSENGRAMHWVREAFGHCKAIGAIGDGAAFVKRAIGLSQVNFNISPKSDEVVTSYGVVTTGKYDATSVAVDAFKIGPGSEGFASNFAHEISKHRCWERETDGLAAQLAY